MLKPALDPNNYGLELEDHINISCNSLSPLGRLLTPEYSKVIDYPYLGKFVSVYSFWVWLRDIYNNDSIRRMNPNKIREYIKDNTKFKYVRNFRSLIAYATWLKIKNQPKIRFYIKNLPDTYIFLTYETVKNTGVRIQNSYPLWLLDIANEIVRAIKSNKEPVFTFLSSHPGESNYCYTEGFIKSYFPNIKLDSSP